MIGKDFIHTILDDFDLIDVLLQNILTPLAATTWFVMAAKSNAAWVEWVRGIEEFGARLRVQKFVDDAFPETGPVLDSCLFQGLINPT